MPVSRVGRVEADSYVGGGEGREGEVARVDREWHRRFQVQVEG